MDINEPLLELNFMDFFDDNTKFQQLIQILSPDAFENEIATSELIGEIWSQNINILSDEETEIMKILLQNNGYEATVTSQILLSQCNKKYDLMTLQIMMFDIRKKGLVSNSLKKKTDWSITDEGLEYIMDNKLIQENTVEKEIKEFLENHVLARWLHDCIIYEAPPIDGWHYTLGIQIGDKKEIYNSQGKVVNYERSDSRLYPNFLKWVLDKNEINSVNKEIISSKNFGRKLMALFKNLSLNDIEKRPTRLGTKIFGVEIRDNFNDKLSIIEHSFFEKEKI